MNSLEWSVSQFKRVCRGILRRIRNRLDYRRSLAITPESTIQYQWESNSPFPSQQNSQMKRLCLFAHYDTHNQVAPYVFYYLDELKKLGCDLVFISTCAQLNQKSLDALKIRCSQIYLRKNIGFDLGSWKVGLTKINLEPYEELILANDTVYGPFSDMNKLFQKMSQGSYDIWGITDSWEYCYHLQSYFLVLSKKAFTSPFFKQFWNGFRYLENQLQTILNYELGFSQQAVQAGLKLGSFCDYRLVRKEALEKSLIKQDPRLETPVILNPTLYFWDVLVSNFDCPFLKTRNLKQNPLKLDNLYIWEDVIKKNSAYNTELILDHLRYSAYNSPV